MFGVDIDRNFNFFAIVIGFAETTGAAVTVVGTCVVAVFATVVVVCGEDDNVDWIVLLNTSYNVPFADAFK